MDLAPAYCLFPISKQLDVPWSSFSNAGPLPRQDCDFPSAQVLFSRLHISPLPSSHHAPRTFGVVSPTFAWLNPATKPSAATSVSRAISRSRSHAATPLLSPAVRVLFCRRDVPCTAYHVRTPVVFRSEARRKRRRVIVVSVSEEYCSRSDSGLAR